MDPLSLDLNAVLLIATTCDATSREDDTDITSQTVCVLSQIVR